MHLPATALPGARELYLDPAGQAIASQVFGARQTLRVGAGDSPTFAKLTLSDGQVSFPATQVPSSDPNTLDDYEEGAFTPSLTFATPGDLAVAYSAQAGFYTKMGRMVTVTIRINTSTFTFTTASGQLQITGLPFSSQSAASSRTAGALIWGGITKVGYTQINTLLNAGANVLILTASGSGVATSTVTATDAPTGGTISFDISHTYFTA